MILKPAPKRGRIETARWLLRSGMLPIVVKEKTKRPLFSNWGTSPITRDELERQFSKASGSGIGIALGPIGGVVDLEVDSPAGALFVERLSLPETVGWRSCRGHHKLFKWDKRLAGLPTIVHFDEAELRIGGEGKQTMSITPPTVGSDRRCRRWLNCWEACAFPECLLRELDKVQDKPRKRPERPVNRTQGRCRYAAAALRYEAEAVAKAPKGARNNTLNRAAFCLGTLVGAGMLDRDAVEAELTESALLNGLGELEVARTLRSGLEAGILKPRKG